MNLNFSSAPEPVAVVEPVAIPIVPNSGGPEVKESQDIAADKKIPETVTSEELPTAEEQTSWNPIIYFKPWLIILKNTVYFQKSIVKSALLKQYF